MKRSIRSRKVGAAPWLIGLVLVGGTLVCVFSLDRSRWLSRLSGLDINGTEWRMYNTVFDRHPAATASSTLPFLRFGISEEGDGCLDAQPGGSWSKRWMEGDGYGDTVQVRNLLDQEGFLVRCKKNARYKDQRRFLLTPASAADDRVGQLGSIANDLGLITPSSTLIRVLSCARDLGVFHQMEQVDEELLERRGITGATLVKQGMDPTRPDQQFAVIEGDSAERVHLRGVIERALQEVQGGRTDMLAALVEERSAIAWLLMAWIDGRDLRMDPVQYTYQWSTGRFSPIYQVPTSKADRPSGTTLACNLLTPLLRRPTFKAQFEKRQAELAAKLPELQQLWASVQGSTSEADPLLSVSHITDRNAVAFLDRPLAFGPGHATFMSGMSLPPVAAGPVEDTVALVNIAKRYKLLLMGDSIIFPRGKYVINEDLQFPAGRAVLMLQGARIFMAAGRSIVCKGDLYVRGSLRNPVFIRAQDDRAPFGSIAVLGNGSQQCAINGLYISGGKGAELEGIRCEGMVTVQGAGRTMVMATVFQGSNAEASLLVNGGDLEMHDVRFEDKAKEFVRLQHVQGILRDVTMVGERSNTTTGLRISSGTLAVVRGIYTGMRAGAFHAEGAAQLLVRKARLSQNAVAFRSEARAVMHVEGNVIDGNDLVFSAPSGGTGVRITAYPNTLSANKVDREQGANMLDKPALDEATVGPFGVQLNEPGPAVNESRRGRTSGRVPGGN